MLYEINNVRPITGGIVPSAVTGSGLLTSRNESDTDTIPQFEEKSKDNFAASSREQDGETMADAQLLAREKGKGSGRRDKHG